MDNTESVNVDQAMPDFAPLRRSLLISVVVPAVAIQVLGHYGVPLLKAILIGSVFPFAELVLDWSRTRRFDLIAIISIGLLALSCVTTSVGGDPRVALAKDGALATVFGLVFLGSLLAPRPLIYYVSLSYMAGATADEWERRWQTRPVFRTAMRTITAVWGVGLVANAALHVALVLTIAPAVMVVVGPAIAIAVFGGLIAFTIGYIRWIRRNIGAPQP